MKLLVVAPTADQNAVGESWIAYQWTKRLADRHDVTVLSYSLPTGQPLASQIPNARVVEWRESAVFGRYERFNAMLNPGYVPFFLRARKWIRAAVARGEQFDVGHQICPISLRYPSPLDGSGVEYIIGPVGGSLASPPAFRPEESGAQWFTALRNLDEFRLRHDPLLRRSFKNASCVIGIADYVRDLLGDIAIKDFRTLSDTGIETLPLPAPGSSRTSAMKLLFVGRVIRTKGVRDAIRALSMLPPEVASLDVVGDGYDRTRCEELAVAVGVQERVHFHGRVPHERVLEFYKRADIFVFPSYREAGGIVVTEAMSYGLPVIVCDSGGPSTSVDQASGIKVPALNPQQLAAGVAEAIAKLASSPQLRHSLGSAARSRILNIGLWDRRIEWMESLYLQKARPRTQD